MIGSTTFNLPRKKVLLLTNVSAGAQDNYSNMYTKSKDYEKFDTRTYNCHSFCKLHIHTYKKNENERYIR